MNMTLAEIRDAAGAFGDLGPVAGVMPKRIQTDSRLAADGDLFCCIQGDRFDGHMFAAEAIRKGAVAVLAERPLAEPGACDDCGAVPLLLVDNTIAALGRLAARRRMSTDALVVGVTGSAGKTTVKEMLAGILGEKRATSKNFGNLNNTLGLPLSIFKAEPEDGFWVMELGISVPEDMPILASILRPNGAVITNVGPAHLEGLGDIHGVAFHKATLLRNLRPGGWALVNYDQPELREAAQEAVKDSKAELFFFSGKEAGVRFSARYLGPEGEGQGLFGVRLDDEIIEIELPCRGDVFAENTAAAAGAAVLAGLDKETIIRGLRQLPKTEHRFQRFQSGNYIVIDDTYNANPLSMNASIQAVSRDADDKPLVLVLGEMKELGPGAGEAHRELGRTIAAAGAAAVFWHGGHGEDVSKGLAQADWKGEWIPVETVEGFSACFKGLALREGVLLFKGSRSNKMETYMEAFMKESAR